MFQRVLLALAVMVSVDTLVMGSPWFRLVQLSDLHLVDEESPARLVKWDGFGVGSYRLQNAYRQQEDLAAHMLDGIIRRINSFSRAGNRVDGVILTGDLVDNAQYNELRWCIDIMDGDTVDTDSGANEDPVPGPGNDPNDLFRAVGLDRNIPWYAILGNHDLLAQGNLLPAAALAGRRLFGVVRILPPTGDLSPALIRPRPLRAVPYSGSDLQALPGGRIVPDVRRHWVTAVEYMREMMESSSPPRGHGFSEANLASGMGCYSVLPHPGVPVRLLGIDTAARTGNGSFGGEMTWNQIRHFLIPELVRSNLRKELVWVAGHHPVEGIGFSWETPAAEEVEEVRGVPVETPIGPAVEVEGERLFRGVTLRYLLHQFPNVVGYLCGHNHVNRIIYMGGNAFWREAEILMAGREMRNRYRDPTRAFQRRAAPHDFYQIMTTSMSEFPAEARILELEQEGEGRAVLRSRMLGLISGINIFVDESRRRMWQEVTSGLRERESAGTMADRENAFSFGYGFLGREEVEKLLRELGMEGEYAMDDLGKRKP